MSSSPLPYAGGEVFLDAIKRGGCRSLEEFCSELEAVGPVVVPSTARSEPLADAQNAKAVLLIVEGDPLDKAGKHFGLFGVCPLSENYYGNHL